MPLQAVADPPTRRDHVANKVLEMEAETLYPGPRESEFDADGEDTDYITAPDIAVIAAKLLNECTELKHLRTRDMRYLWKKKGGEQHGQMVLGRCVKPSGLAKFYSECDWIVCISADNVDAASLTRQQVEALVHHELLHAGADEIGRAVVIGHDFEGFGLNVKRYGAWTDGLRLCRQAWQQLPLFGEN